MKKCYVIEALMGGNWINVSVYNTEFRAQKAKERLEEYVRDEKIPTELRIEEIVE